jgi:hypothetical protein
MLRLRRPERGAGSSGSQSRSNTMTSSKWGATAFAAARPPIPAPMTTACCKIGFGMCCLPMDVMSAETIPTDREAE